MIEKKERNSNLELMRIISTIFIILWHIRIFGNLKHSEYIGNMFNFFMLIFIVHVNSFVLVTGYFQSKSKFKWGKVLSLFGTTYFYKLLFIVLFVTLGLISITKTDILNIFLYGEEEYWYVKNYIILYLISPFLNVFIENISKEKYIKLLILLFIIMSILPYISAQLIFGNNGYSLYNFIFLYLIGAYIRKYPPETNYFIKVFSTNLYRIILLAIFFTMVILNFNTYTTTMYLKDLSPIFNEIFGKINAMLDIYSNPFVIIESVAYFLFFLSLNFKSKFINRISTTTFSIYLIHHNHFVRQFIYKWLRIDSGYMIYNTRYLLYLLGCGIVIFSACAIIDLVRQSLFKLISNLKLSKKIKIETKKFFDSIKINIPN